MAPCAPAGGRRCEEPRRSPSGRLTGAQASLLMSVVSEILAELRLTDEQRALADEVVPRYLRAIANP